MKHSALQFYYVLGNYFWKIQAIFSLCQLIISLTYHVTIILGFASDIVQMGA